MTCYRNLRALFLRIIPDLSQPLRADGRCGALWLLVLLCLSLWLSGLPNPALAFDMPGLGADANAYTQSLRAKSPPQPNLAGRDAALKEARQALDKGDGVKAVRAFEKAVTEGDSRPETWLALSSAWTTGASNNPQRALQAAFMALRGDPSPEERVAILQRLATLLEERLDQPRHALAALKELMAMDVDDPALTERIAALRVKVGLTIERIRVNEEDDPPRACIELSGDLSTGERVRFQDFVRLDPAIAVTVNAREDQLCVGGLEHGRSYKLTLRQGLPGTDNLTLHKDETITVRVGNRHPSVAFRSGTYILPRLGSDNVPVTTVNLEAVNVAVYRIHDRNLTVPLNARQFLEPLTSYQFELLAEQDGEKVGSARLEVARGTAGTPRNQPVTTGLPIRSLVKDLKPGLYVVMATPADLPEDLTPYERATQWLLVSDLGLTSMAGADGVHVFVRSLATAQPLAGVSVALVARNNTELGRAMTDAQGYVLFPSGLAHGSGGNSPLAVMAYGPAPAEGGSSDYAVQDLTTAAFDLSDRGVGGRAHPGPLDGWVYTERGVYRPGEIVHLAGLLRDARTAAVADFPLTIKVLRSTGTEYRSAVVTTQEAGGFSLPMPLSDTAPKGTWTVQLYADPKADPIGYGRFNVEDFIPERLAVSVSAGRPYLETDKPFDAVVQGRFLYGPPAAGLGGSAELVIDADPNPFPGWPGYRFGLEQDTVAPRLTELALPVTDTQGQARLVITAPALPDTTRLLRAELRVAVSEPGGRPSRNSLTIPVRTQPFSLGIKSLFDGHRLSEGQEAMFDVVAVDAAGTALARDSLRFELFAEHRDFRWYFDHGRYSFRAVTRDESLRSGNGAVMAGQPWRLAFGALPLGRYRLEVTDGQGRIATSVRFQTGWEIGPQTSDTPDSVEVTTDRTTYRHGDTATVRIAPPFAGEVLLTVATDRIHWRHTLSVPTGGTTVAVPVDEAWGPGAYVTATVFRPPVAGRDRLPVRAIGLAWLGLDPAPRTLGVTLEAPELVRPRGEVTIPVRVTRPANAATEENIWITLAAVDEGILQLTRFQTPDPTQHFFAKRSLRLDIRDDYGRLIDPAAQAGILRPGGDGMGGAGLDVVPITVVALFSGPVKLDASGMARIPFTIPDFNGQLRVMAVAYDRTRLGAGSARMTVRDPLVADSVLPRFLAPGDDSRMTLSLHAVEAPAGRYQVTVTTEGPLSLEGGHTTVALEREQRQTLTLPLRASAVGIGSVMVSVRGPEGADGTSSQTIALERKTRLQVRPARAPDTTFNIQKLEAGASAGFDASLLNGYLPGSAAAAISYSSAPPFNVVGVLRALQRYPYGCLEQVVSRALPLLALGDVAQALGREREEDNALPAQLDKAIARTLDKQRYDGAFGVWSARGEADPWLTAYATDFLTRARSKGYTVPEGPYSAALTWLRQHALDGGQDKRALASRAYALQVLTLAGVATPGTARYLHDALLDKLPTPLARAQLGTALARAGDTARAEQAFNTALNAMARDIWAADYGSSLRDAAAVLVLLAESGLPDNGRIQKLLERLPASEMGVERTNTQEQAWLLLAAHSLMKASAPLKLTVNGQPAPVGDPLHLTPSPSGLGQKYTIRNAGSGPVWQAVSVQGVPQQPRPAAHEGLRVKRYFFRRDGQPYNLDQMKQNDVFVLVLEAESHTELNHDVVLVQPLPAGWEIENTKLGAGGTNALSWLGELTSPINSEVRDDRYVAALNLEGKEAKAKLAFLVRVVTPGSYELPGATLEDMYKSRFFSRQATGRVTIQLASP